MKGYAARDKQQAASFAVKNGRYLFEEATGDTVLVTEAGAEVESLRNRKLRCLYDPNAKREVKAAQQDALGVDARGVVKQGEKELKDAVVGDYFVLATGMREFTKIRRCVATTGEGALKRIFFDIVGNYKKEWRRGFDVNSGRQSIALSARPTIVRYATPDEVAELLAEQRRSDEERKARDEERLKPEAVDASFILSCTDEQLIAVGAEKLAEFAMLIRGVTAHADTPRKMDGDDDEDFGDVTK